MLIRSRAPLRLGFSGGGTDVSPYCDLYGGHVLNATINRYAYATIELLDSNQVNFYAADMQKTVSLVAESSYSIDGALQLHKAVYNYFIENYHGGKPYPMTLTTFCDAPVGSGLGASSTLVVSMVKAFDALFDAKLDNHSIADLAYQLERVICGFQGGKQDQYSAAFGGMNFMTFHKDNQVDVNPLSLASNVRAELESSLLLFYTGASRASAEIIKELSHSICQGRKTSLDAMHGLKKEAFMMKKALQKGDFEGFNQSLSLSWQRKKATSDAISNSHLDEVYHQAIHHGALSGKVSGAGGGGFMLFFVPSEKRMSVVNALQSFNGQISFCHFTDKGAEAWHVLEQHNAELYSE